MKGLTFILTDKCNITCDFCAPDCGPKINGNLSAETMIRIYDELKSVMPVANVVFTGGEPTLFLHEILPVLNHIKADDVTSRIVTNAYWGKSEKLAHRFLNDLKNASLYEFNFSVDDFHQKYIPYDHIKTAVDLALEYGFPVLLAHKTYPNSQSSLATFEKLLGRNIPVFEELPPCDRDKHLLCFSSGNTIPVGRGTEDINFDEWVPDGTPASLWQGPCEEVLKNITIQADGSVSPCCGLVDRGLGVFYSGSTYENNLGDIIKSANQSTLYNWLALEGPEGLMNEIKKNNPQEIFDGKYLQNCQLCQEIFSSKSKMETLTKCMPKKVRELSVSRLAHEALRTTKKQEPLSVN